MSESKHEEWIEYIRGANGVAGGITLSQWEEEFVESVEGRLQDGKTLTEAQAEKLEQIWDRI